MTKKKVKPDDPAQAARFAQTAKDMEAAGELNLTEAEAAFDRVFNKLVTHKPKTVKDD